MSLSDYIVNKHFIAQLTITLFFEDSDKTLDSTCTSPSCVRSQCTKCTSLQVCEAAYVLYISTGV